jgi:tRNA pseudouridine(55) synthase
MKKNSGLHLLYKDLGETPNQCILRFKDNNPEYSETPMTYAGRLDPMAEGLLIVLSGDETKEKEKYLNLPKTYEFEVLWGFETDTLDLLGRVVKSEKSKVIKEEIKNKLNNSVGKFEQVYPDYSSKPVSGKPLFQWAREGRLSEIEIPKHEVEIFEADFISRREISKDELLRYIVVKVSSVSGDFRQKEILEYWSETLSRMPLDMFVIDKIKVTVSSGFYVRQFVSDLAEALGTVATTFHIKRTKIGDLQNLDDSD